MDELDQLLAAWGSSRRPSDAASERIRTVVLDSPAGLPVLSAAWWRTVQPQFDPARAGLRAGNRVLAGIAA